MTTPLRLGFLFSGLLHVAVVAAFSLSSDQEIPALDGPRPLTLRLALFEPAQAAPSQQLAVEKAQSEPVEQPIPADKQMKTTPLAETPPPPLAKQAEPRPPKPRPAVKPVSKPKRVTKRSGRAKPVVTRMGEASPVEARPASSSPVTLAAVAEPRPVMPAAEAQEKQHYLAALAAKINHSKYYPMGSRRRGEEGRVVVRFIVQKNGDLTDLTVVESSGSRRLDAAALKTLRRATPFRPIPDELHRDQWSISVPIAFSLNGRP